jgi:hypothetical protein
VAAEIFCKPRPQDYALDMATGMITAATWPFKRGSCHMNMPYSRLCAGSVRPWFVETHLREREASSRDDRILEKMDKDGISDKKLRKTVEKIKVEFAWSRHSRASRSQRLTSRYKAGLEL